jgi:hypothetical protein
MGKKIAPATKNPHIACAKQVKMCVSHAIKQAVPMNDAQFMVDPPIHFSSAYTPTVHTNQPCCFARIP